MRWREKNDVRHEYCELEEFFLSKIYKNQVWYEACYVTKAEGSYILHYPIIFSDYKLNSPTPTQDASLPTPLHTKSSKFQWSLISIQIQYVSFIYFPINVKEKKKKAHTFEHGIELLYT